jgi:hypothetical protein
MTMHKLRNPDVYPYGFHEVLRAGGGTLKYESERKVRVARKHFYVFMWNLTQHPLHMLHKVRMGCEYGTKVERDKRTGMWELRVTMRPKPDLLGPMLKALEDGVDIGGESR